MPTCTHVPRPMSARPLAVSLVVTAAFTVVELIGGILTGSLALVSDSAHMVADAAALGLSLFALWLSRRPADRKRTYGYYRLEILAALVNGVALWVMVFFIFREAVGRLFAPSDVSVAGMIWIGLAGLAVNAAVMAILFESRAESLNVRAAFLHVAGDALGSIGVVGAGIIIGLTGYRGADPVAGMVIGVLILYNSWGLMTEAVHILMEGSPSHLDLEEIRSAILGVDRVDDVHDLHLWTLTPRVALLSAHVVAADPEREPDQLRRAIESVLAQRFALDHTTIQVERERCLDVRNGSAES